MSIGRVPGATGIQPSIVTAKGDLIVATASGSVTNQAVGSNNQVLMADSAQADGVKWANEATATLTTTGDLLYASAANTPARLAIGSTNQVLTVSGGVPTWATAASGGMTLLSTTTLSGTQTTISSISQDYVHLQIIISGVNLSGGDYPRIDINGSSGAVKVSFLRETSNFTSTDLYFDSQDELKSGNVDNVNVLNIYNYASSSYYKAIDKRSVLYAPTNNFRSAIHGGAYLSNTAVSSIKITTISGASFNGGQVRIYGVK